MNLTSEKASELGKKSSRKGIPNKSTIEIRKAFQELITSKLPELSDWIDRVAKDDPEKALGIIAKYSEFVLPKLQRTEIQGEVSLNDLLSLSSTERQARILQLKSELGKAQ